MIKKTFTECLPEIDQVILLRKRKWRLESVTAMGWEDVAQILRLHIFNKWHQYKEDQPLKNWLNTIISNQLVNLIRNNYGNYTKPCDFCPCSEGGDLCSIYTKQSDACELYKKWKDKKQDAYNTKITVSLENHSQEVFDRPGESFDVEKSIITLNKKLETLLKPREWNVYKLLFIDNVSEEEAAKVMGYTTKEKGRVPGYRTIINIKKNLLKKVKKIVYSEKVDIYA